MKIEMQAEASECGLACLAMVAGHHGNEIGLRALRARHGLSLKGTTLQHLSGIAQEAGFRTRALRLEASELAQLRTPCILHWDLNHFVVLVRATRSRMTILDPAFGKRVLDHRAASRHFTGVALELSPTTAFEARQAAPSVSMRQLTGRVDGLRRSLALVLALSVALQCFTLLAPFYMQWVVDQVLVSADRDLLAVLGIGFGLLLVLRVAVGLLRGWTVVVLSNSLGLQWVGNVFSHLLRLPLDFFEKRHLGDVVSRMGSISAIQKTLTTSFVEALIDGLMALATLAMMLLYSWKLALITLAAVAVYLVLRAAAFWPLRAGAERQLVAAAKQQTHLLESLRGMQSVKVACVEPQRGSEYANLLNEAANQDVWMAKVGLGFSSANQLLFGAERIVVVWLGSLLALQNVLSVGMLVAYLAYKDQFATRVGSLIDKWIEFRMLRLHGERLADIVLAEPERDASSQVAGALPEGSTFEVRSLSFRYAEHEPWVIRDCSFRAREGESVAIVGASGSGKTTLVKLMLGLLAPAEGSVEFCGKDIRKHGLRNYRRVLGAVMQDDQLFAGSLIDNIAFGAEEADPERVEAAARLAAVHDEIVAMPMGYHSLIGDMGTTLSGGQKQRVILARALYRNPRILFLDEATSHLDVDCERLVSDAVRRLKLVRIIVAHRPETIASADRVLLLEDGTLREVRPQRAMASAIAEAAA